MLIELNNAKSETRKQNTFLRICFKISLFLSPSHRDYYILIQFILNKTVFLRTFLNRIPFPNRILTFMRI